MRTQSEVRQSFWDTFPEFKNLKRSRKTQNDYPADVRISFVDFVESLRRNNEISESLAQRVTL